MEVSNRKPASPETRIEQLERDLKVYRNMLAKINAAKIDFKSELWDIVKQAVQKRIDTVNQDQEALALPSAVHAPDRVYWFGMGQKACASEILAIEAIYSSTEKFEKKIEELKRGIDELKRSAARTSGR